MLLRVPEGYVWTQDFGEYVFKIRGFEYSFQTQHILLTILASLLLSLQPHSRHAWRATLSTLK
jgi:hypothetical protein